VSELEAAIEYHVALARYYRQWGEDWPTLIEEHAEINKLLEDRDALLTGVTNP
jgi:hypothetical protein